VTNLVQYRSIGRRDGLLDHSLGAESSGDGHGTHALYARYLVHAARPLHDFLDFVVGLGEVRPLSSGHVRHQQKVPLVTLCPPSDHGLYSR
jgi:hypothetical protein